MIKIKPILFGLLLYMLLCHPVAADQFEDLFKQQYVKEMLPELRLAMTDRLKMKGLNKQQIDAELNKTIAKAAACQLKTFEAYGKKYRNIAYKAMLTDLSTEDATFAATDAMNAAVDTGEISKNELNTRLKQAMSLYNDCVIKNELVHK